MTSRLADRLRAARRQGFVGREAERDLFASALAAEPLPFCVLHVYGPGGVGKTTLLGEFERLASNAGASVYRLDARDIAPLPEAFLIALAQAAAVPPSVLTLAALAERRGRQVLIIDTYETFAALDGWVRETLLPELSEATLVVLAGRHPPTAPWRIDPGWHELLRTLPLRNLSPRESRAFLAQRAIPTARHAQVLDFTHGHPLALSLVADVAAQRGDRSFQPEIAPDVVRTLVERFAQEVPDTVHRMALEACAMMRLTTEALLAQTLSVPDTHALFAWLRGLSFIESGPNGVVPHDLARDALILDLRWRNPEWYRVLHDRARTAFLARLATAQGAEQQRVLFDYIFLHRDNPVVRPFYNWDDPAALVTHLCRPADLPTVLSMVERHEGAESARVAADWAERQPENVLVFRAIDGSVAGCIVLVSLHLASEAEIETDPGARACWRYLQRHASARSGESVTLFRFWMAADTYQAVSTAQSVAFVQAVRHYLATPGLAYTFFPCADPSFWVPVFAYAELARLPDADFEVGGRRYGVYGHDWRSVPPMAWLQTMAEREMGLPVDASPPPAVAPLLVLSEPTFAAAVRAALQNLLRPEALRSNPLLRSRCVVDRSSPTAPIKARVAALIAAIEETAATLQRSPRDAKLYRALDATYLHPVGTQEQAAEALDLPFSTFRRHLSGAVARITAVLWRAELGGSQN